MKLSQKLHLNQKQKILLKTMPKLKDGEKTTPRIEARIKIIAEEILKGLSRSKITEKYTKLWDVKFQAIDSYINDAYKLIRENAKGELDHIREINTGRLLDIYNSAEKSGDTNAMFRAIEIINRMSGMYVDKQKVEVTVKDFEFGFADDRTDE